MNGKEFLQKVGLLLKEQEEADKPVALELASGEGLYVRPSVELGAEVLKLEGENYVPAENGTLELANGNIVEVEDGKVKDIKEKVEEVEFSLSEEEYKSLTDNVEELKLSLEKAVSAANEHKEAREALEKEVSKIKDALIALADEPAVVEEPPTPSASGDAVDYAALMETLKGQKKAKINTKQ